MEKLKKFETEEEFLEVKNTFDYPTVSFTQDSDKVWVEKQLSYISCTYIILEEYNNKEVELFSSNIMNNLIDYVVIDGVKQDNIVSKYTFNDFGEHDVIFYLKDLKEEIKLDYLFIFNANLKSIDFSNFKDSKYITSMIGMFESCEYLENVIFGNNFNTSNVKNMSEMFAGSASIKEIDLSMFDMGKCECVSTMFYRCWGMEKLDLSNWKLTQKCLEESCLVFTDCGKNINKTLDEIIIGDIDIDTLNKECILA